MTRLTRRDRLVYEQIWSSQVAFSPSSTAVAIVSDLVTRERGASPARLVDLGCGVGRNALHAARTGIEVVAVDHHPSAIAKLRIVARDLPMTVHQSDLVDWLGRQGDDTFDAAFCFDALHHLSNEIDVVRSVLAQLRRIVRRGGHILVTLLCDIAYSSGEKPPDRLTVDTKQASELFDEAFAGLVCKKKERGAKDIRLVCVLAAPEGVERFCGLHPDVPLWVAGVDEGLDQNGYILPGLGDAGDRAYGTR